MAKWDKNSSYGVPTLGITTCQFFIIANLYFFLVAGPLNIRGRLNTIETIIYLIIFFGLEFYNNKIYKNKFNEFEKRWGNESKKDKTIGIIKVILFIIFSWGLIFINAWIYDLFI